MGLFKKEKIYKGNIDIQKVATKFSDYLTSDKWKVQSRVEGNKVVIQAQKGGILRDIVAADRALTFVMEKVPEGMKVTVGVGKWIQNLAVTAIETLLLSELFLVVDVPEMLWNSHVENELLKKLDDIVNSS
ncbi:hypothetical protein [Sulfolobus acidocaldarius]|uniref:Conserved Archaeal protein n=4 Tax=Sulfolobus acidocaldarius TaxID=2285 RepID=Q4J7X4_SULAC|nr:hypothetical protein [Sulfolobus acidocaldarius]AAY81107.1 conserved Archaeal protein [Sulfolobus acidocaldarius DSM 639]AGE71715.1 hypothetical protein SacN8_08775 [Sulfolobus acidocaldarius N8]AGE73988.1 hypothetical protein SacRon12I_08785 [Sulfolobus acidocaldarius Ron12/I]ALU30080.1 hypothetical protein ATY89_09120 [Sulfolobus acidocaldarius]ALU30770.1 hypothetical protein ATZ20_00530 [Sulfolobus acidocaldarius]